MSVPFELPVAPMLARAVDAVPDPDAIDGGWAYEPKWDGFRCIIIRDGDQIELGSRSKRPLTRYFPEVVAAVREFAPEQCVIDSELVVRTGQPGAEHLDWEWLSQRIHPAQSRIDKLSAEHPGELVCFDLLSLNGDDWTGRSYDERREGLELLFDAAPDVPSIHLSRMTTDAELARRWFIEFEGAGLDGVVAKSRAGSYQFGKRTMLKIKHKRTADAVVVGYRIHKRGHGVGSLLLGMYDEQDNLLPVGGIGAFSDKTRDDLEASLAELVVRDEAGEPVILEKARSRFADSKDAAVIALEPELVVEVDFDQLEGRRFRHAVTFKRFRPDKDPIDCRIEQVDRAKAYDLADVLEDR